MPAFRGVWKQQGSLMSHWLALTSHTSKVLALICWLGLQLPVTLNMTVVLSANHKFPPSWLIRIFNIYIYIHPQCHNWLKTQRHFKWFNSWSGFKLKPLRNCFCHWVWTKQKSVVVIILSIFNSLFNLNRL